MRGRLIYTKKFTTKEKKILVNPFCDGAHRDGNRDVLAANLSALTALC